MLTPTIGILAGMGPRSTGPFVDLIVTECQRQYGAADDLDFPPMMIHSLPTPFYLDRPIDHAMMQATIGAGLRRLAATGAAFIAMPCNSAHIYYDQLAAGIDVPLLNMIEIAVQSLPPTATRIALLAARPTVEANLYQAALRTAGRECVVSESLQRHVDHLIGFIKASRDRRVAVQNWQDLLEALVRDGLDAALIACTDLNAVQPSSRDGIAILDATECLARRAVRMWCERRS